jgi:hypothetical protein
MLTLAVSCSRNEPLLHITSSAYPIAVDVQKAGSYPALTKSGAGYFYDDVLEYRVWINPPEGGDDYYRAFPRYEDALDFSKKTMGAEEPLVLIRQQEWIDEPNEGEFIPMREERITEWRVKWLSDSKRTPGAIERFLKEHKQQSSVKTKASISP